jgi:L-aspartate oxidase
MEDGRLEVCSADVTVMATGGIGGLFDHSTNFSHLTGDAIAIAVKHGVALKNIDYVQIHPTTFYDPDSEEGKSFLISESVRGEGAILLNENMERFTDELQPRDIVTKAIREQMIEDGAEHVWEDLRPIPEDELKAHFPNIVEHCRKKGYDVTKEPIPVVPAQHYFMGGIDVNYFSKTTMDRLYAIGETACNGVHGKNRLASNSLLESLVFAKRAALDMKNIESLSGDEVIEAETLDLTEYQDAEAIKNKYKELVLNAIQNAREESERNV